MPVSKFEQAGAFTVARDGTGKLVEKVVGHIAAKGTWRNMLRKMTDNGLELYSIMLDIARGKPFVARLDDGRESEPVIPAPAVRLAAAKELAEFLNGKAVTQDMVVRAEEEAQKVEQLQAMSEEQLWAIVSRKSNALAAAEEAHVDPSPKDEPE